MRTALFRWLVFCGLLAGTVWACSSDPTTGGTTTASSTAESTSVTSSTASSTSQSVGPVAVSSGTGTPDTCIDAPDGMCQILGGEDCDCVDCKGTAFCIPDLCTTDGVCDPLYDSCICSDCDTYHFCSNPQKANCMTDGMCDSFHEGCTCPDCATKPDCVDNIVVCTGGKLDGFCDANETRTCADCFGRPKCVPCDVNGMCDIYDPCSCVDCINDDYCTDPKHCTNDLVCDILAEGCICPDCMNIPECNVGTSSSSGGGAGGAGGSVATSTATGAGGGSTTSSASTSTGAGGADAGP